MSPNGLVQNFSKHRKASDALPAPSKSRPGESFKNGKLYHFDSRRILVAKAWPEMRAWYKTATKPWQPTRKVGSIMNEMFPKGTPIPSALSQPFPFSRKAICERCESDEGREWLKSEDGQEWLASNKGQEWLENKDDPEWREQPEWSDIVSDRRHLVLAQFFDTIPDPIREFVLRFKTRRWHLLALFARCPRAFDLAQSNPALAYALASNWVFHQPAVSQPMRAARALVNKKQRHIMAWLGFPTTEQVRRILAKIPPEEIYSVETLLNLRRILGKPEALKMLSHVPVITHAILVFLNDRYAMPFLAPNFINELSLMRKQPKWPPVYGMYFDVRRMVDIDVFMRGRKWNSIEKLQETHDELVEEYNQQTKLAPTIPFPQPPYCGKKGKVEPISSFYELQAEGRLMSHCIGSYAPAILSGKCYVYRVLAPIRATMSLWRISNQWKLQDIRGSANSRINDKLATELYSELINE